MENDNIISNMEQYDFNTPINVTMIYEEDSEEAFNNKNSLIDENQNNNITLPLVPVQLQKIASESVSVMKCLPRTEVTNGDRALPKRQFKKRSSREKNQKAASVSVNKSTNGKNKGTAMGRDKFTKTSQIINNNTKDSTTIEQELLATVSDRIIVIMQHYYNLRQYNETDISYHDSVLQQFNELKYRLFRLSYGVVVSLILPQANNKSFMNKLIAMTAFHANKTLQWNCQQKHVVPFYIQLLEWAKQQREYLIADLSRTNSHKLPMEHLNEPSQQGNIVISLPINKYDTISNNDEDTTKNSISMNLFTPSVSINILPQETYVNKSSAESNSYTKQPLSNKQNGYNYSTYHTPKIDQLHVMPQHNKYNIDYIQQRPPPPYISRSENISPSKLSHTRCNINETLQNISQRQYLPMSQSYPTGSIRYPTQMVNPSLTPSIAIGTLQTPTTFQTNRQCCVCGKNITSGDSKSSHCSSLCQVLDAEMRLLI